MKISRLIELIIIAAIGTLGGMKLGELLLEVLK